MNPVSEWFHLVNMQQQPSYNSFPVGFYLQHDNVAPDSVSHFLMGSLREVRGNPVSHEEVKPHPHTMQAHTGAVSYHDVSFIQS